MRTMVAVLVAGAAVLTCGVVLGAHHSFSSEYDGTKTFKVSGVVSKVEWTNPHVRFYVDVSEADGKVVTWNMELASPSALARNGWSSRTLKVGDKVTVDGYPGKAVATRGNARSVLLADGRSLFAGTADDSDPGAPPRQ
jgi:Na+-transporting NADH:ubiquinone oxidoreductase subunit NqrF